jgi:hypothetical protein
MTYRRSQGLEGFEHPLDLRDGIEQMGYIGKYISQDKLKEIQIYKGPGSKLGFSKLQYYVSEENKETHTTQRISLSTNDIANFVANLRDHQWIRA